MTDATEQAKHTPGPWDLSDTMFGDAVYDVTAGSAPPATVGWVCRKPDEGEAEANARLVAAAPELLEAAEDALQALVDADQDRFDGGALTGQLRAAIAKAKGGRDR